MIATDIQRQILILVPQIGSSETARRFDITRQTVARIFNRGVKEKQIRRPRRLPDSRCHVCGGALPCIKCAEKLMMDRLREVRRYNGF